MGTHYRADGGSAQRRFQLRNDLEQILHQTEVGDLEDRRLAILVDGHDGTGVLDAGEVLGRAGDADRHVQLGRDDLAGPADPVAITGRVGEGGVLPVHGVATGHAGDAVVVVAAGEK